jgi:hypothetical protein
MNLVSRFLIIIIVCFAAMSISFAQIAFYDAQSLRDSLVKGNFTISDTTKIKFYGAVLVKYLPADYKHRDDPRAILRDLAHSKSPYFNPFLAPMIETEQFAAVSAPLTTPSIGSILPSSIGSLDVTALADGMAKFLVKRAKQELTITFFDNFKEVIADTIYRDLRTLFPATYATLTAIGDQIYYYDAYLQMLRDSFKKDLRDIPLHLPIIFDNHADYFAHHPEVEAIFRSGLYVYDSLNYNKTFGPILRNYPITYLNKLNPNIKASVQTAILISESLRDTAIVIRPNAYWVKAQQIETLVDDSIAFKIYLGLLYQQAKNDSITFADNVSLTSVLDSVAVKYNIYSAAYRTYFLEVGDKMNTLTMLINDYKTLSGDTVKLERYSQYVSVGIDLLETATNIGRLGLCEPFVLKVNHFFEYTQVSLSNYLTTIRSAANLVCDIKQRNYTSAIVNTVQIYTATFSDTLMETGKTMLKYGTFMASVAQAKTSDEVESAIEATALPVGSARLKKESCIDVSLNAYVGGFVGMETDQSTGVTSTNTIYGINAPIGIALSTSYNLTWDWIGNNCWRCPLYLAYLPAYPFKSITLFGSILDLGAVTAYRTQNDTISNLPKIALANIIAPGIHIVLGVKGAPISLGFGWQIGPQLRDVTSTITEISNVQGHRWAAFVAVDIPLLDFYNIPNK